MNEFDFVVYLGAVLCAFIYTVIQVLSRAERKRVDACPKHCWHAESREFEYHDRCCHCAKWRGGHVEQVEGHGPRQTRWVEEP